MLYWILFKKITLHHLERPIDFLQECWRIARKRVVIVEVTPDSNKSDALNKLESFRDPSHVRFPSVTELMDLLKQAGYGNRIEMEGYRVQSSLKDWRERSFFADESARESFEKMLAESLKEGKDSLDLRLTSNSWSHPVSIVCAEKT